MNSATQISRPRDGAPPSQRRILIVDDNHEMVASLQDIVAIRGWASDSAYSGEEAVLKFCENGYDAVLMDIRMPGMNGVDAFLHMKERRPETPVILMTAYTSHQLVDKASAEGVVDVLGKPVSLQVLFELLERIERD